MSYYTPSTKTHDTISFCPFNTAGYVGMLSDKESERPREVR